MIYWISYKLYRDKEEFFFNTLFRLFYEAFLDILFASVFSIYNTKWEEERLDIYSNVVSIVWIVVFVGMLMLVPIYCYVKRSKFRSLQRLKMLMEDFKPENRHLMMDHFVFMLRRSILVAIIVVGWNHGFIQVTIFLFACISVLVWKIIARPFEDTLLNFQDTVFEFFICVVIGIFVTFKNQETELIKAGKAHIAGIICFVIVFFLTVFNFFISMCIFIRKLRDRSKKDQVVKTSKICTSSFIIIL